MTIKLYSLARWSRLNPRSAVVFDGLEDHERRVRIELNVEAETRFYIEDTQGNVMFLCTVPPGIETVEFNTSGTFSLFPAEGSGEVYYQSADLEPTHIEIVDPETFTTIAERRQRNPELEEILYRTQLNMERRLAQQAAEMELMMQRMERTRADDHDQGTAAGTGGTEVSGQGTEREESGPPAGEPAAGAETGSA